MERNINKKFEGAMSCRQDKMEGSSDARYISIPVRRYDALIRAENERDTLLRAYHAVESYRISLAMEVIFGKKPVAGEPDAE